MTSAQHRYGGSLYSRAGERKYLTPAERSRFLDSAWTCHRPDLRTLALTLAFTGCRISEALALTPRAIARDGGFIALRSLKRRNGAVVIREVPVPGALLDELDSTHGLSRAEPGDRLWSLSRSRAWSLIKDLMAEAGILHGLHATPKGLRHAYGLHAIRSGIPLNLLQRWLGHAKLATTAIYAQAMGEEEREIASRMWLMDLPKSALIVPPYPPVSLWLPRTGLQTGTAYLTEFRSPALVPPHDAISAVVLNAHRMSGGQGAGSWPASPVSVARRTHGPAWLWDLTDPGR